MLKPFGLKLYLYKIEITVLTHIFKLVNEAASQRRVTRYPTGAKMRRSAGGGCDYVRSRAAGDMLVIVTDGTFGLGHFVDV
jgi:hypothetical protein